MNSCILMAQITSQPQLRYTQENQTPLTEMMVEFSGLRDNDPPASLKVVAWGDNLANDVAQNYHAGDQVILEGRLRMNILERQEGFKEKRAEFTLSRIHGIGKGTAPEPSAQKETDNLVEFPTSQPQTAGGTQEEEKNLDDIPF
ncbi:MAG: single-stranded DNA-binding protein [Cyanobacteria bacterium]|jgi:single-stranded DNA-binding protein|nr:single-stranded DNA-binding protein [Cyanobacteria bacterium GSL.Bin1]